MLPKLYMGHFCWDIAISDAKETGHERLKIALCGKSGWFQLGPKF